MNSSPIILSLSCLLALSGFAENDVCDEARVIDREQIEAILQTAPNDECDNIIIDQFRVRLPKKRFELLLNDLNAILEKVYHHATNEAKVQCRSCFDILPCLVPKQLCIEPQLRHLHQDLIRQNFGEACLEEAPPLNIGIFVEDKFKEMLLKSFYKSNAKFEN